MNEQRFALEYRIPAEDHPGLALQEDGTVVVIDVDGNRTPVGGAPWWEQFVSFRNDGIGPPKIAFQPPVGLGSPGGTVSLGDPDLAQTTVFVSDDGTGAIQIHWDPDLNVGGSFSVFGTGEVLLVEAGAGAGFTDRVSMPNLPVADPHYAGELWSNVGVVTVSAG